MHGKAATPHVHAPGLEALEPRLLLSGTPWGPGDATMDDVVDLADLSVLAAHWEQSPAAWAEGDFDDNGEVNLADLSALAFHWEQRTVAAEVTLRNLTGAAQTDWPVFLTVWEVFGPNMDPDRLDPEGFHVFDAAGTEAPHMLRPMPPDFSLGNDEIVFVVPAIAAGESRTYRVTNTSVPGDTTTIDLIDNPHNMMPNAGLEDFAGGLPAGYTVTAASGASLGQDTSVKHSGDSSLQITYLLGGSMTLKSSSTIPITGGGDYHFSAWVKTDNLAYTGYGFWNSGGSMRFENPAFTGADEVLLRDSRQWYCYRFDSGGEDAWGVPEMTSRGAATRNVRFVLSAIQKNEPILLPPGTGTIWLDEVLLYRQPEITVNRQETLEQASENGALIFARPVNMPLTRAGAQEATDALNAFAMRGERRQVRFGVQAVGALSNVAVSVSDLTGPGGTIGAAYLDLERLANYVTDYSVVGYLSAGSTAEYLLGIDVQTSVTPGTYTGTVTISSSTGTLKELPLTLEVLPMEVPAMEGIWIGGIYNIGYPLDRDDDFYVEYGKCRFNYMMLFDYFSTHMIGDEIDLAGAAAQVAKMTALAHVTNGIGLYREPNINEDQPRKWYQIASGDPDYHGKYVNGTDEQYKAGYQALAVQLTEYGEANGWPELLYMVSDEPDQAIDHHPSLGWLNEALPDAMTPVDAQFHDMIDTWQYYTLPVLDDPVDWTGPMVYDYVRANSERFGICGKAWDLESGRYQPGLMMATTGAVYWHWWHTQGPFAERNGTVERMHHVAAMGAGANDLRYYVALTDAIAAHPTGPGAAIAAEAQAYLDGIFAFATGDHDTHVLPFNGVPWDWGDVRFYDRWRETMKDYLLALDAVGLAPPAGGQVLLASGEGRTLAAAASLITPAASESGGLVGALPMAYATAAGEIDQTAPAAAAAPANLLSAPALPAIALTGPVTSSGHDAQADPPAPVLGGAPRRLGDHAAGLTNVADDVVDVLSLAVLDVPLSH